MASLRRLWRSYEQGDFPMNTVQRLCFQLELRRNLVRWLAVDQPDQIFQGEDAFHVDYPTITVPQPELAYEAVPCMAEGGKVQRVRVLTTRLLDEADDLPRLFGQGSDVAARLNGGSITGWKLVVSNDNPWPLRARVYVRLFQFGHACPRAHQVQRFTMATFLWYQPLG